jgi:hypothetical protein
MRYILERLKEASTWRGIIAFAAGSVGWELSAEMAAQVVAAGVAVSGLIGMLMPDRVAEPTEPTA